MPDPDIRSTAIGMLARRTLTRKELRERLKKKKFPPAEVNSLVAEYYDKGYIDEKAIIEDAARMGREYKRHGRFLIQYELRKRGLAEAVVDEILDRDYPAEAEYDVAFAFADHKVDSMSDDDADKKRNRLGSALHRRGFGGEVIRRVLEALDERLAAAGDEE